VDRRSRLPASRQLHVLNGPLAGTDADGNCPWNESLQKVALSMISGLNVRDSCQEVVTRWQTPDAVNAIGAGSNRRPQPRLAKHPETPVCGEHEHVGVGCARAHDGGRCADLHTNSRPE